MSTASHNTNTNRPVKGKSSQRRNAAKTSNFVDSLSPAGQINRVLGDLENLNGGYHLRNWSASARRELYPHITIKVEVLDPNGKEVEVSVPKLAFFAASPAFRRHISDYAEAKLIRCNHKDVTLESMRAISKWLRKICTDKEYTDLPIPNNLQKGLELHLTARTLGMAQYTQQVIERYIGGLVCRTVEVNELVTVAELTCKDAVVDPILEALANHVAYLCRYHLVSKEQEDQYVAMLTGEKCGKLVKVMDDKKIRAVAENGWEAVYRRPLAEIRNCPRYWRS